MAINLEDAQFLIPPSMRKIKNAPGKEHFQVQFLFLYCCTPTSVTSKIRMEFGGMLLEELEP